MNDKDINIGDKVWCYNLYTMQISSATVESRCNFTVLEGYPSWYNVTVKTKNDRMISNVDMWHSNKDALVAMLQRIEAMTSTEILKRDEYLKPRNLVITKLRDARRRVIVSLWWCRIKNFCKGSR